MDYRNPGPRARRRREQGNKGQPTDALAEMNRHLDRRKQEARAKRQSEFKREQAAVERWRRGG